MANFYKRQMKGFNENSDPDIRWDAELPDWIHKTVNDYNQRQREAGSHDRVELMESVDEYGVPFTNFNFFRHDGYSGGLGKNFRQNKPINFGGYYDPHSGLFGVNRNSTSNFRFFASSIDGVPAMASGSSDVHYQSKADNLAAFLRDPTGFFDEERAASPTFSFGRHQLSPEYVRSMRSATFMPMEVPEDFKGNLFQYHQSLLGELRARTGIDDWASRDNLAFSVSASRDMLSYATGVDSKSWQRTRRGDSVMFTQDFQRRSQEQGSFRFFGEEPISGTRTRGVYIDNPLPFAEGQSAAIFNSGWVGLQTDYMIPNSANMTYEQLEQQGWKIGNAFGRENPEGSPFHFIQANAIGETYGVGNNALVAVTGLITSPLGTMAQIFAFNPWHGAENKPNPGTKGQNQGRSLYDPLMQEIEKTTGSMPDYAMAMPSKPGRIMDLAMRAFAAQSPETVLGQFLFTGAQAGYSREDLMAQVQVQGGLYGYGGNKVQPFNRGREFNGRDADGSIIGMLEGASLVFQNNQTTQLLVQESARQFLRKQAIALNTPWGMSDEQAAAIAQHFGSDEALGNWLANNSQMTAYNLDVLNNPRPITASGETVMNTNRLQQMSMAQPMLFAEVTARDNAGLYQNPAREFTRALMANTMSQWTASQEARPVSQELLETVRKANMTLDPMTGEIKADYGGMMETLSGYTGKDYLSIGGVVLPSAMSMAGMLSRTQFGDVDRDKTDKQLGSHIANLLEEVASNGAPSETTVERLIDHLQQYIQKDNVIKEGRGIVAPALTGVSSGNSLLPSEYAIANEEDVANLVRKMGLTKSEASKLLKRYNSGEGMIFNAFMQESYGYSSSAMVRMISPAAAQRMFPGAENVLPNRGSAVVSSMFALSQDKDYDADRISFLPSSLLASQVDFDRQKYMGASVGAEDWLDKVQSAGKAGKQLSKSFGDFFRSYYFPDDGGTDARSIQGQYRDTAYAKGQMQETWSPFIESVSPLLAYLGKRAGLENVDEFQKHVYAWGKQPYQSAMDIDPSTSPATEWMKVAYKKLAIGNTNTEASGHALGSSGFAGINEPDSDYRRTYGGDLPMLALRLFDRAMHMEVGASGKTKQADKLYKGEAEFEGFASHAAYALGRMEDVASDPQYVQRVKDALIANYDALGGVDRGLLTNPDGIAKVLSAITGKIYSDKHIDELRALVTQKSLVSFRKGRNDIVDDVVKLMLGEGEGSTTSRLEGMSFVGADLLAAGGSYTTQKYHVLPELTASPRTGYGSTLIDELAPIGAQIRTGSAFRKGTNDLNMALATLEAHYGNQAVMHIKKELTKRVPITPYMEVVGADVDYTQENEGYLGLRTAHKAKGVTGGDVDQVAGEVHGGEYVLTADEVNMISSGQGDSVFEKVKDDLNAPPSEESGMLPGYRRGGLVRGYYRGGVVGYEKILNRMQDLVPEMKDLNFREATPGTNNTYTPTSVRTHGNVSLLSMEAQAERINKWPKSHKDQVMARASAILGVPADEITPTRYAIFAAAHEVGHHLDRLNMTLDEWNSASEAERPAREAAKRNDDVRAYAATGLESRADKNARMIVERLRGASVSDLPAGPHELALKGDSDPKDLPSGRGGTMMPGPTEEELEEYYRTPPATHTSVVGGVTMPTAKAVTAVFGAPPAPAPVAAPKATPAAAKMAAAAGVPLSAITPSASGTITVPAVKAHLAGGGGGGGPVAGGGSPAATGVTPPPPDKIAGYITQDNKGDVKWTEGANLTPDEIAAILERHTSRLTSGHGIGGAEDLRGADMPKLLGQAIGHLDTFINMSGDERRDLSTEEVERYQRLLGVTQMTEKAYKAAAAGDRSMAVPAKIRKMLENVGVVNQQVSDLGYSGISQAEFETSQRNIREGAGPAAAQFKIDANDAARMPAMDNFIRTMRDVSDVVGQVNSKHEIYISQAKQMLSVFDQTTQLVSHADASLKAAGGNLALLSAPQQAVLLQAGAASDPTSLRSELANRSGDMEVLRQSLAGAQVGNAANLWGGSEEGRQGYLTSALLRRGRLGQLARESMPDEAFEGGLDTGMFGLPPVKGEGAIRALGGAARFTGGLIQSLRAMSYIRHDFVDPMAQSMGQYQNILSDRQMALSAQGGISANELMDSDYGVSSRRRGVQRNIAFDAGQQLNTVYGGVASAFPGMGRTEAFLQSTVGPAAGAAIAAGQIFQNEFAGPLVGGLVFGAAALNYVGQTGASMQSSAGAWQNFLSAGRQGGRGGQLLDVLTNPGDALALVGQRIFNPELANKSEQMGGVNDFLSQYYGQVGTPYSAEMNQRRQYGNKETQDALIKYHPELTEGQIKSGMYANWMSDAGSIYGLSDQAGSSLYSWNQRYNPNFSATQPFFRQQIAEAQRGMDFGPLSVNIATSMGYSPGNDAFVNSMRQNLSSQIGALPTDQQPSATSNIDFQTEQLRGINQLRSQAGMSPINPSINDPRLQNPLSSGIMLTADQVQAQVGISNTAFSATHSDAFALSQMKTLLNPTPSNQSIAISRNSGYQMAAQMDFQLVNMSGMSTQQRLGTEAFIQNSSQYTQDMLGRVMSGDPYASTLMLGKTNPAFRQMDMQTGYRAMTFSVDASQYSQIQQTAANFGQSNLLMSADQLAGGTASLQGQLVQNQYQQAQYSHQTGRDQALMNLAMQTGGASVGAQGFAVGGSLSGLQGLLAQYGQSFNPGNGMGTWQIQDAQTNLQRTQQAFGLMQQGVSLGIQRQQLNVGTNYQRTEMNVSHEHAIEQNQWQMEDLQFGRAQMDIQFGWQQQDFTRNIRYARGREKRDLMREQQRSVVSYAMQAGHEDVQEGRVTTQAGWENERFQREKTYFDQNKQWQEQQLQLQEQAHQKAMEWNTQEHQLEDQERLITRQYQTAQQQIAIQVNDRMFQLSQTALQLNTNLSLMQETMQGLINKAQLLNVTNETAGIVAGESPSGQGISPVAHTGSYTGVMINGVALPAVSGTAAGHTTHNTHFNGGSTGRGPSGAISPSRVHYNEVVIPENGVPVIREQGSGQARLIELMAENNRILQKIAEKEASVNISMSDQRRSTAPPDSLVNKARTRIA